MHAVLFVTSLSCYDQVLFQDNAVYAFEDAFLLWSQIVNSHYFENRRTSMVIFFSKIDLFM